MQFVADCVIDLEKMGNGQVAAAVAKSFGEYSCLTEEYEEEIGNIIEKLKAYQWEEEKYRFISARASARGGFFWRARAQFWRVRRVEARNSFGALDVAFLRTFNVV